MCDTSYLLFAVTIILTLFAVTFARCVSAEVYGEKFCLTTSEEEGEGESGEELMGVELGAQVFFSCRPPAAHVQQRCVAEQAASTGITEAFIARATAQSLATQPLINTRTHRHCTFFSPDCVCSPIPLSIFSLLTFSFFLSVAGAFTYLRTAHAFTEVRAEREERKENKRG